MNNRHDFTYDAVCGVLDKISVPFKQFIEKCKKSDLDRALSHRSSFMAFEPFCYFKHEHDNGTYTFMQDCLDWEYRFDRDEGERYAMLLFDEVSQMIEEQLERAKETDKPAKGDMAA